MITKVDKIDMVPDDIKELLLPDRGEMVVIGQDVYNLHQFPVKPYFALLGFLSKYFTEYNEVYASHKNETLNTYEFLGILAKKLLDSGLVEEMLSGLFPEIPDAAEKITYDQLQHLLGVIYKLNFLAKSRQIRNMETRNATDKMMKMLGLSLTTS